MLASWVLQKTLSGDVSVDIIGVTECSSLRIVALMCNES